MAKLEDIAELAGVKFPKIQNQTSKKRRPWLDQSEQKKSKEHESSTAISSTAKKGVDQPPLKPVYAPPLNQADQPPLKPVYAPPLNQVDQPPLLRLADLKSNPLKIILYFYDFLVDKKQYLTGKTTLKETAIQLRISPDSARTAVRFLLRNKLIERAEFKGGRNGWSRYLLSKNLAEELKKKFPDNRSKRQKFQEKRGAISSSSIYKTTTTELPEDWLSLNFEQHEELKQIGFTLSQLKQLYQTGKLTADIIESSLNYLVFDIKNNAVLDKYPDLLNVFMGAMRKGNPWAKPKNYKTQQELNLERLLVEKEEERAKIKAMEEKLFHLAYEEWLDKASKKELTKLLRSPHEWNLPELRDQRLKPYFTKTIWPTVRDDYLN